MPQPQRQDSFSDDKFRVYHNMNAQSSQAGPLGLVQPPPAITPPALGGNTGLGLGKHIVLNIVNHIINYDILCDFAPWELNN